MRKPNPFSAKHVLLGSALVIGALAACGSGGADSLTNNGDDNGDGGADTGLGAEGSVPFEPVGPPIYVPRVKNLMTGLAATDAEIAAVVADPTALTGLVNQWMALPEFQGRMMDFFRNGFQQNQVTVGALGPSLGYNIVFNGAYTAPLERNIMDSFPMTVWNLVQSGQPFNKAITTNQYMMTTAMMTMLSYVDDLNVDDTGKVLDRPFVRDAIPSLTFDQNETATLAETLDPTNTAKYMHWKLPTTYTGCAATTAVSYTNSTNLYPVLFGFMQGTLQPYTPCVPTGNRINFPTVYQPSDYTDWRLVTLNLTDANTPNTTPVFFDILKMRAASTMTLHTQRIGYFGTMAFDSNWATNASNEARVTANQALIVAIGQSIAGENEITKFPVAATESDMAHAANPACAVCHQQLDPYKQFFRQSYSLTYHDQLDTSQLAIPASFVVDGVSAQGTGVGDLANILATHPRLPLAWAEKLHFWATSTAPQEDDPELLRIAGDFQKSNYDFKTLARELFTSPLITLAAPTETTTTAPGVILSITRRDQICTSLSNRLGLPDVCGQESTAPTQAQATVASRALLLPVDTYYRAYALPSLPTNPDLFFRDTVEAVCSLVADQVIDVKAPGTSKWVSTSVDPAIADFVSLVMDIQPSDPRSGDMVTLLKSNYTDALASAGSSATLAMKSTFMLACIAPTSVVSGL